MSTGISKPIALTRGAYHERPIRLRPGARAPYTPANTVALRIGIDIGGTFTDLVALDEATGAVVDTKALSTPQDQIGRAHV